MDKIIDLRNKDELAVEFLEAEKSISKFQIELISNLCGSWNCVYFPNHHPIKRGMFLDSLFVREIAAKLYLSGYKAGQDKEKNDRNIKF